MTALKTLFLHPKSHHIIDTVVLVSDVVSLRQRTIQELKLLLHSYYTTHLYVIYCMFFTNHEVCN